MSNVTQDFADQLTELADELGTLRNKLAISEKKLAISKLETQRITIVARAGWESARALAIAGLHRATERAADEALEALGAGAL